jgi:hypothetical protein
VEIYFKMKEMEKVDLHSVILQMEMMSVLKRERSASHLYVSTNSVEVWFWKFLATCDSTQLIMVDKDIYKYDERNL